ncbi:hypothetical protein HPB52_008767 [Rhipicephalus sanguineus]|uniref:Tick transposon n=1 Tax=Rhipicephalus sanguineus TaxID=34632 RepID=A0A9D4SQ48_RHISA|nr:hypothetical protein HPB52_008767 [Rhipicephalus sanguineus]
MFSVPLSIPFIETQHALGRANSTPVPIVSNLRVLGLILQSNHRNSPTIYQVSLSVQQTARIQARVRARCEGMHERDLLRLIDTFVISRLTYGLPYTNLLKSKCDNIDVLMSRAYKTALGLPPNASTECLLLLGLVEAHRTAQVHSLCRSPTSRWFLSSIGHDASSHPPELIQHHLDFFRPPHYPRDVTDLARHS